MQTSYLPPNKKLKIVERLLEKNQSVSQGDIMAILKISVTKASALLSRYKLVAETEGRQNVTFNKEKTDTKSIPTTYPSFLNCPKAWQNNHKSPYGNPKTTSPYRRKRTRTSPRLRLQPSQNKKGARRNHRRNQNSDERPPKNVHPRNHIRYPTENLKGSPMARLVKNR